MSVYYPEAAIAIEVIPEPEGAEPKDEPEGMVTLYVGEDQLDDMDLMEALATFISGRADERAKEATGDAQAQNAGSIGEQGDARDGEEPTLEDELAEMIAAHAPKGNFPYTSYVVGSRAGADGDEDSEEEDDGLEKSYEEWLEDWLDTIYSMDGVMPAKPPLLNVGSCKNLYVNV